MDGTLAILGTGRMGEALLSGLLRSGWARPDQVWCTVRSPERAALLASTYGVQSGVDSAAAADADVLLLAPKPQDMDALLEQIAGRVRDTQTVVSMAAGVPTRAIEDALGGAVPVVRVMSNVPVLVDEAMSALARPAATPTTRIWQRPRPCSRTSARSCG